VDIIFKGRHTDVQERFRERATEKIIRIEKLEHKAIRVHVEVSAEHNPRQSDRRERVELTITSRGPAIRAEAAGQDRYAALDMALAKLEAQLRRVGNRRKARRGTLAGRPGEAALDGPAAAEALAGLPGIPQARPGTPDLANRANGRGPEPDQDRRDRAPAAAAEDGVVPIEMEGDGPLVVREKFHPARPMAIDQALYEMELVGHDFFLFRDAHDGCPSVVYRRRGYQYGVIRLMEDEATDGKADGQTSHDSGLQVRAATDITAS
jgi:ribosomal subunit interface protein